MVLPEMAISAPEAIAASGGLPEMAAGAAAGVIAEHYAPKAITMANSALDRVDSVASRLSRRAWIYAGHEYAYARRAYCHWASQ